MRLLKSHPILGLVNSYAVDSPQPANLSYMWNFGSLLGLCLVIQIITGVTLAMHYTPSVDLAFVSVEHIMNYNTLQFTLIPAVLARLKNMSETRPAPQTEAEKVSFLQWLAGFVDAEGSFGLSCGDRGHWRWLFRIRLHLDDINTLRFIQSVLGVGRINTSATDCVYVVDSWADIINVIIPLFTDYPLLTTKRFDFACFSKRNRWAAAAQISISANTRLLVGANLSAVLALQKGMNLNRVLDYNVLTVVPAINLQWLLGFVEGEGTFGFKNLVPYFQVAQHVKNVHVLNAIALFLSQLTIPANAPVSLTALAMSTVVNKRTNVQTNSVTGIDNLFFIILPLFISVQFVTRKGIDFNLWAVAILLYKLGHVTTTLGRSYLLTIEAYINSSRYTTNPAGVANAPDYCAIWNLLSGPSPIDLNSNLSHAALIRTLTLASGSRAGYTVYVYENGTPLSNSPFSTYGDAQEALGLKRNSRTVSRYIDTTKVYKGKYTFRSTPR